MNQNTLSESKEKILAYLYKYGNTRLSDLENYVTHKLNFPKQKVKDLLADMVLSGELEQVIHEELSSAIAYVTVGYKLNNSESRLQAMLLSRGQSRLTREQMDATMRADAKAVEEAEKKLIEREKEIARDMSGVESKFILTQAKEPVGKHPKKS